jgi:thioredoxin-related protein
MKIVNRILLFTVLFIVSVFIVGCASTNKNYRDATGVIKIDTRSTSGINK